MSVTSEIERIKTNIANIYAEAENKGAIITGERNSDNLASVVTTIPSGGNVPTKGFVVDKWDNYGYATEITVVGLTSIPSYYFYKYSGGSSSAINNITKINLPSNTTSIGSNVFESCNNLASIELPSTLKTIGNRAFYTCRALKSIELPNSLTSLGDYAFYGSGLTTITVPSKITTINQYCFRSCASLTEAILLGNITKINSYAFQDSSKFAKLVMPNVTGVPTLSSTSALQQTAIANKTGYIYVPDTLVESFKSASNWSTYATQIKGISEMPTE